ncbi:MAG: hypothetical protein PHE27_02400 [Alphaproteobacteria bacterium]|nr:hypothetical protein [Alphaproteobacteria bacterium]
MNVRTFALFLLAFAFSGPALADDLVRPDDTVAFDLNAEDWVSTKSARVVLSAEAAVNETNEGSMRAAMAKAVDAAAKADWRMTGFSSGQDQTGMERWSVTFEARLPEANLGGLSDALKKVSKAGMQIKVANIDFSPSPEEIEAARATLRSRIYKQVAEQLASLNASIPGRSYRIAQIVLDTDMPMSVAMPMYRGKVMAAAGRTNESAPVPLYAPDKTREVSKKLVQNAHVVFAALPPAMPK